MQLPGLWEERGAELEGLLKLCMCLKKITDSERWGNGPVGFFWAVLNEAMMERTVDAWQHYGGGQHKNGPLRRTL